MWGYVAGAYLIRNSAALGSALDRLVREDWGCRTTSVVMRLSNLTGQAEGIVQTSIDLPDYFRREPPKAAYNLVPRHRGEGLAIHDAVEPEVRLPSSGALFRHENLTGQILMGAPACDRGNDDSSTSSVVAISLDNDRRPAVAYYLPFGDEREGDQHYVAATDPNHYCRRPEPGRPRPPQRPSVEATTPPGRSRG